MSTLTLEYIDKLLNEAPKRGKYEPRIDECANNGEFATNFSAFPEFQGMDAQSVRNSVNQNIEKHSKENDWPNFQVVIDKSDKDNHQVVLINLDLLAEARAEAESEVSEADGE
jgi:hypothetical protein